jgi:hypothetical protein
MNTEVGPYISWASKQGDDAPGGNKPVSEWLSFLASPAFVVVRPFFLLLSFYTMFFEAA